MNLESTATEAGRDGVNDLITFNQLNSGSIQVGVLAAMPQMHFGDFDDSLGFAGLGNKLLTATTRSDGVKEALAFLAISDPSLDFNLGRFAADFRGDLDARTAAIIQINMALANTDDADITVQAAIEGEVSHLGIDSFIGSVVYSDNQQVAVAQSVGHIHTPGGITAVMMSQVLSIQINIGRGVGTLQFQIVASSLGQSGFLKALGIVASSAMVIIAAILAVNGVPAVRQIDLLPVRRETGRNLGCLLGECPLGIEIVYGSH
jgi:hypothetical protein